MTSPKAKPQQIRATISIPGLGRISVGPEQVHSTSGTTSPQTIVREMKKVQKGKYLPPISHVYAE